MAVNEKISAVLKDLPLRILTPSYNERKIILHGIISILDEPEITEPIIKGVSKLLPTTLHSYKDHKSQGLVKSVIFNLLKHHPLWTNQHLSQSIFNFSQTYKTTNATKSVAKCLYAPLSWSFILMKSLDLSNDMNKASFETLVRAQSILMSHVVASTNPKLLASMFKSLRTTFEDSLAPPVLIQQFGDALLKLEPNYHTIILGSYFIRYLKSAKLDSDIPKYKNFLLDAFIKMGISAKVQPPVYIIRHAQHLLSTVTPDEFKTLFLPAFQRSMLRSPEILLPVVRFIVEQFAIDLSPYSLDLGKLLGANLYSKDDSLRSHAVLSLRSLSTRCLSSGDLAKLVTHLVAVFNGSEGKLTVPGYKMSVLEGIGSLSENKVSQDSEPLVKSTLEQLLKILETEVHEKTIVVALQTLTAWLRKLHPPQGGAKDPSPPTPLPPTLITMFKKCLAAKTISPVVRGAYFACLVTALDAESKGQDGSEPSRGQGGVLGQVKEFQTDLIKSVERAVAQPTQAAVVHEAIPAAILLLRVSKTTTDDTKLNAILESTILNMKKQVLLSEKILMQATPEVTYLSAVLATELLLHKSSSLRGPLTSLYRTLLLTLTSPQWDLRRQARGLVRSLYGSEDRLTYALELLREMSGLLNTIQIQGFESKSPASAATNGVGPDSSNKENKDTTNSTGLEPGTPECISSSQLYATLLFLVSHPAFQFDDKDRLALAALPLGAHDKLVAHVRPESVSLLLTNVLHRLNIRDEKQFVLAHEKELIETYVHGTWEVNAPGNAHNNVLRYLTGVNPAVIWSPIFCTLTEFFEKTHLAISNEDYFTFLTPPGQIYDKTLLESLGASGGDSHLTNMKRESKAYSYRDQLEEIQLRKELEAKKAKQGKVKETQYTPKQKEAIKAQLDKESDIRSRVTKLNASLVRMLNLLRCAFDGHPAYIALNYNALLPLLLSQLNSPLAAPAILDIYEHLIRAGIFDERDLSFAHTVVRATLRLASPRCDLPQAWSQEPLPRSIERCLAYMSSLPAPLSGPGFCFCFQLIRYMLAENTVAPDAVTDTSVATCLSVIADHSRLRHDDILSIRHPITLPRKNMFSLLLELIGSGKLKPHLLNQLEATCLAVASSGTGQASVARASFDEISVLLGGLKHPLSLVREVSLKAVRLLVPVFPSQSEAFDQRLLITGRLWVVKCDSDEKNRPLADLVWEEAGLNMDIVGLEEGILEDIIYPVTVVQESAARALAELLKHAGPPAVQNTIDSLLAIYQDKLAVIPPKIDSLGRVAENPIDIWEPRSGVALALAQLVHLIQPSNISQLASFYVSTGLADRNAIVRQNMLTAALVTVDMHGKHSVSSLLPIFENLLDRAPKNSASYDSVRQSVVILMGSLARHLEPTDARIKPIVKKLIEALSTPSQQVQEAVANCLPPLVNSVKDEGQAICKRLLKKLLDSDNYGERKGAAYGLAGMIKGLGILVLKQYEIMASLTNAIQNKKNYKHREGSLIALQELVNMLGRVFEPYIVNVLPHLLLCFGDNSTYVRQAASDCAQTVMSKLSAHGVKLVLPSLLAALEEDSWRTKTGSVELLGAMAYCAPKQLSACLPSIVPKLITVLSDSHIKVQQAGADALRNIGSVIRNPEIQEIVPILLEALQDPSKKTDTCLQTLLDTQFVHFIDAPSLALIMPVVQRAYLDRSTETRKMAAQIIGNMYSLTDQKDLTPYLPTIIPGLKSSLLDPVPEVRSVSARALGAMVKGMGESSFEDLLPWLKQTLTSESSSVDRSGAAQGLSEVVGGLGVEKLHKIMPEIISTAERTDIAPHVKDGYIMMFIYLPVVFTQDFTVYIGQIITPILKALADENEFVRETALKAGQRIVTLYADSAILLLLPELENGLFDDNWRIRYASVKLLGDLLYRISGVSGKMTTETASDDDNFGTEHSHRAILEVLGAERRNRVLAGLYMGRSDVALMVRQAALHVWKVVVSNTPRTLREILPTLFGLLLGCLASASYDKRQVAARTLGDLVRKLGERVLPEIIPILERGLDSPEPEKRQGVCVGLSEIMSSTSRDMVLTFVNSLVPTVRKALCDPLPEVRQAAAKTFDSLHSTVGVRALDDILPNMLTQLNNPDPEISERTLDGLRQVMAIKSRVVLPYLVPQLTQTPVNTKALAILASVAGDALSKYLHKILPALQSVMTEDISPKDLEYCQGVILAVSDEAGVRAIMDQLLDATRSENIAQRRPAVILLGAFCAQSKVDYSYYNPVLLRGLIFLLTDQDHTVLVTAWEALGAVIKTIDAKELPGYVQDIRQSVRFAMTDIRANAQDGETPLLPGFCLPKGITPVLPVFREAILNGEPEVKESAALGLGEVIACTSPDVLQSSVVNITGPLIRILGDRFNWNVKAAVLQTLAMLLSKVGIMLKQFLPQLQTTFLKALYDQNRVVRLRAAHALSHLIPMHNKPDAIYTELVNGIKSTEDPGTRETMLQALRGVIGDKMSDPVRKAAYMMLREMLNNEEDALRSCVAGCLGCLIRYLSPEQLNRILNDEILADDSSITEAHRHGRSTALYVTLKESPSVVWTDLFSTKISKVLSTHLSCDKTPLVMNAVRGCGYLFKHILTTGDPLPGPLLNSFTRAMNHPNNDVKQLVAKMCTYLAKSSSSPLAPDFLRPVIPMLVNGTKEKNGYVKANSEYALVAVLKLRTSEGSAVQNECMNLLDVGAKEALSDVITKVLRKVANQPEGKEELDETLLG
uniref:eIF-2-alpha kinase activator GCN1 n=1 Tax=Cacopsylla melanoneura TaxID=428564 RepID=A0A8D8V396_9HEMI